jgi:hypothetical protein
LSTPLKLDVSAHQVIITPCVAGGPGDLQDGAKAVMINIMGQNWMLPVERVYMCTLLARLLQVSRASDVSDREANVVNFELEAEDIIATCVPWIGSHGEVCADTAIGPDGCQSVLLCTIPRASMLSVRFPRL